MHKTGGVLNLAVAFLEALDAAGGVHQLLLAGEERMACRADLGVDFLEGRTGLKCVSAETLDSYIIVRRVDTFSHLFLLQIGAAKNIQVSAVKCNRNDSDFFLQPFFSYA
jgi:hypothetical protein